MTPPTTSTEEAPTPLARNAGASPTQESLRGHPHQSTLRPGAALMPRRDPRREQALERIRQRIRAALEHERPDLTLDDVIARAHRIGVTLPPDVAADAQRVEQFLLDQAATDDDPHDDD